MSIGTASFVELDFILKCCFFAKFAKNIIAMTNHNTNGYFKSAMLLLLIAIVATVWMRNGVEWNDDLQYMRMPGEGIRFWYSEGPLITSFAEACEAVPHHFSVGSSRLPNIIQVFFNVFPPQLVDLMHGVMIAILMLMVVISTNGKTAFRSIGLVGVSVLAVWVMLPWYDHMLASVFLLNYVWVSVVSLLFMRIFYSNDCLPSRWKFLQWEVALILGLSHEGFSFPIIAGALMVIIIDKSDRRRRLLLTSLVAIGAISLFLTPGMLSRMETQVTPKTAETIWIVVSESLLQILPVYMFLLVAIVAAIKQGWRFVLNFCRDNLLYIAVIGACYVIAIASGQLKRALWFVDLVGIIMTLKMLVGAFEWWRQPNVAMGTIAGLLTILSIGGTAMWQSKFTEEIREVCRQVEESGQPIAYVDLIDPGDAPWWTFNVPQSITSMSGNSAYNRHCGFANNNNILILPSRFKNKPVSQWDKVDGSANAMGQFPFYVTTQPTDGSLVISYGDYQSAASPIDIVLNKVKAEDCGEMKAPCWRYELESGDTLYCHNVSRYSNFMRHRKVLSIDRKE